ncbi:hypothetical protein [Thiorhodovibrio frisius]|uniref:Phospholipase A2 n=1 Tax=Thiorhodovibrio frisius TaxID=631362 RepID=H8YYU4_9GAMM|nr:hypothetical protein [Thiorhodovibrio frisius]EIC23620.1 hypothetical protein Thi970DRAFT_01294 [Thiorhodovibrio frisius]WPL23293.1 hypothetical protein Thiofri_03478 [Thiorhodovibrio frisius]
MTRQTVLAAFMAVGLAGGCESVLAFKCMPIYGNWCGIDWPQAGHFPPPIDDFDAACMRHDLCTADPRSDTPCDRAFVGELHALAAMHGGLPRPLQWAESIIRLKAGGFPAGMPMPSPWDVMGLASSLATPCW